VPNDPSADVSRATALQRQPDGEHDECGCEFHVSVLCIPGASRGLWHYWVTMTSPRPTACVFCGLPLADGEPVAGRPPAAAHAACADRALTDDGHWDAIAAASGEPVDEEARTQPSARRAGCLAIALVAAVIPVLVRRDHSRG
jgi:hypothetical protein